MVIPGSQVGEGVPDFKDGMEICVSAGDVVIFDRRTWHAAGSNVSDDTRKVLFYDYAYRWMRPRDVFPDSMVEREGDPIRRQLMGHFGKRDSAYSFYQPDIGDAPLQEFLLKHGE